MPQVIYTEATDEITDLVERVRRAPDEAVALVLNPGTTGFRTPLNVRLLQQQGTRAGKRVSVISGDPRIQELSRVGGLPTFASVPAFERGIQTVRPHADAGPVGIAAAPPIAGEPPPPPAPPPVARTRPRPSASALAASNRRSVRFAVVGLILLALVLLLVVAPSARVTVTLVGQPLTANPTIQGSPDPAAGQTDRITTTLITSNQSAQFSATPSGTQQLPATAATATLAFSTDLPQGAQFTVPKGTEFDTKDSPPVRFLASQTTSVCIGPNGAPPSSCAAGTSPNSTVPVADATPEARGNVAAGTITQWPSNPCAQPPQICSPSDLKETNPQAASGGADAKTEVVASQTDVNSWNTQASQSEQTLTAQANQDMQSKASGLVIARDPGGNGSAVTCTVTPPVPAPNTVFSATEIAVACAGKAAAYRPSDATKAATADLAAQVSQGQSLATNAVNCTKPAVTQAALDGTVVLSIQCTSYARPAVDLTSLKGQLTGHSPGDARNVIEREFDHVSNVSVSQSPIPWFWLPLFSSRIEIDEAFTSSGQ